MSTPEGPPAPPPEGPPDAPSEAPLFARAADDATPEQRLAAVHAFATRCRAYAVDAIARRRADGRPTDEWEVYLRFTDHTLRELEEGTLDHWFAERP